MERGAPKEGGEPAGLISIKAKAHMHLCPSVCHQASSVRGSSPLAPVFLRASFHALVLLLFGIRSFFVVGAIRCVVGC